MSTPVGTYGGPGLGRRYWQAFKASWKARGSFKSDLFDKTEAEFLPAALSLRESPSSASLRWTARLLMAMIAFALVWSVVGKIDIIVNASGKIIPSARTKTIGSVDVASVKALHVVEGQQVHAGDLLIELDSSSSDADHDKAADAVARAALQVARASAMVDAIEMNRPATLRPVDGASRAQWQAARLQLASQHGDFIAKLARLDGEIARYAEALPLATQRASDYRELATDNTVSRHAWLEKEQARIELQGQLADAMNQRSALVALTRKEARDSLIEGEKIIEASAQDRRRAGEHSRLLKLTAPVDGTVQQLMVHTVGGVVPAAQPLMQIVPKESMVEVEAFLDNKDVGFVHEGQVAAAKVEAFDYTRYGTVDAKVRHVSQDAIQDDKKGLIYSTKVVLDRDHMAIDGKKVQLTSGMAVDVEIKTGSRRVIEYVLSPLISHHREALHER